MIVSFLRICMILKKIVNAKMKMGFYLASVVVSVGLQCI